MGRAMDGHISSLFGATMLPLWQSSDQAGVRTSE